MGNPGPAKGNNSNRLAVLDLGTNTFHLLIAEIGRDNKPAILFHETIAVKLGEGMISENRISPDAFDRGISAIAKFKQSIDSYKARDVRSAATSAIRSAENGKEFVEKVKVETGLNIQVIDGEREAELIYHGVKAAVAIKKNTLIVDIGGGSVEFIICDKTDLLWKKSYPIGAARMMNQFHFNDPITTDEIHGLNTYLEKTLPELKNKLDYYQPYLMIGSAGSFETFAALQRNGTEFSFENPEVAIDLAGFDQITDLIIRSNHNQRESIPEIPAVRVDMIVVATLITSYIIKISEVKELALSAYSLKEGVLFEALK